MYVLSKNKKNINFFPVKFFIFTTKKFSVYCMGVFSYCVDMFMQQIAGLTLINPQMHCKIMGSKILIHVHISQDIYIYVVCFACLFFNGNYMGAITYQENLLADNDLAVP